MHLKVSKVINEYSLSQKYLNKGVIVTLIPTDSSLELNQGDRTLESLNLADRTLDLSRARVKGKLTLRELICGTLDLSDAEVDFCLDLSRARIGILILSGAKIGMIELESKPCWANKDLNLEGATIGALMANPAASVGWEFRTDGASIGETIGTLHTRQNYNEMPEPTHPII